MSSRFSKSGLTVTIDEGVYFFEAVRKDVGVRNGFWFDLGGEKAARHRQSVLEAARDSVRSQLQFLTFALQVEKGSPIRLSTGLD